MRRLINWIIGVLISIATSVAIWGGVNYVRHLAYNHAKTGIHKEIKNVKRSKIARDI